MRLPDATAPTEHTHWRPVQGSTLRCR